MIIKNKKKTKLAIYNHARVLGNAKTSLWWYESYDQSNKSVLNQEVLFN